MQLFHFMFKYLHIFVIFIERLYIERLHIERLHIKRLHIEYLHQTFVRIENFDIFHQRHFENFSHFEISISQRNSNFFFVI